VSIVSLINFFKSEKILKTTHTSSTTIQTTTGDNSPNIQGNNNTINQNIGLTLDQELIRSQKPNITVSQFNQLKMGMTYEEVLKIVKIPADNTHSSDMVKMYTWGTETYIYMMLTFINDALDNKSQSGLAP